MYRIEELLVSKRSSDADAVALCVARDLLTESLAARHAELETLHLTVNAK